MPELPDVECFRKYMSCTSLHHQIENSHILDKRILKNISLQKFSRTVKHQQFTNTSRHGKFMFAELDNQNTILFHFGMTGYFSYYKNTNKIPEFTKVIFEFDNGYQLAYINKRMLGQVRVIASVEKFAQEQQLGPDALDIDERTFKESIKAQSGKIKSKLMNQNLIAGIGNVYSDEILFHAGIHPQAQSKQLSNEQISHLYHTMRKVLIQCIECGAQPDQMPQDYLVPRRLPGTPCPKCKTPIEKITVNNRGCYFCPQCQS